MEFCQSCLTRTYMVFLLEFESRPPHPKCAMLPGYTIGRYLTCLNCLNLERNKGIEPFSSAWKAKAQPLYQFRLILLYMLVTYIVKLLNWCPERELNPQGRRPIDFKSIVFTWFHHRGRFFKSSIYMYIIRYKFVLFNFYLLPPVPDNH